MTKLKFRESFTAKGALETMENVFAQFEEDGYNGFETFSLACLGAAIAGRAMDLPEDAVLEGVKASFKLLRKIKPE